MSWEMLKYVIGALCLVILMECITVILVVEKVVI